MLVYNSEFFQNLAELAGKSKSGKDFINMLVIRGSDWNIDINSIAFFNNLGLIHGQPKINRKIMIDFYYNFGLAWKRERVTQYKKLKTEYLGNRIIYLALS